MSVKKAILTIVIILLVITNIFTVLTAIHYKSVIDDTIFENPNSENITDNTIDDHNNSVLFPFPDKEEYKEILAIDTEFNEVINKELSTVDFCNTVNGLTEKWELLINKYYSKLLKLDDKKAVEAVKQSQEAWNRFIEKEIATQKYGIDYAFTTGTAVPKWYARATYEAYRNRAIEILRIYNFLNT